jgi:hypothetical protein
MACQLQKDTPIPAVIDIRHTERRGEHRCATGEHRVVEEGETPNVDAERCRLLVRAACFDRDDRAGLGFVVEGER